MRSYKQIDVIGVDIILYKLIELYDCVWDFLESAGVIDKRPEAPWKDRAGPPVKSNSLLKQFSVSRYFETALTAAEQGRYRRVSKLVRQVADLLVWSQNPSYSEAKLGAHFMRNYVFGLLTGPDAPLAQDAAPSGFLLLGPNTEYPAHSHVPREIYLVLTPDVEWQLDGKKWFSVTPGEAIYHAPKQTHAMRTNDTPMLAFAAWLDSASRSAIAV